MLLCFVDESNRGDFFGFGAVMANETATLELTKRLNQIVDQPLLWPYGIARGKDEWAAVPIRVRGTVIGQVVDAIAATDVRLLMRGVNRSRLTARQESNNYPENFPPEQVCFQHILQRANSVASMNGDYALIIADDRSDRERHRDYFATYQSQGTPGIYMHTKLGRLLDTVHFAPSHRSRMLQAADMVAFLYRRWSTVTETDSRSAAVIDRLRDTLLGSDKAYDTGTWP